MKRGDEEDDGMDVLKDGGKDEKAKGRLEMLRSRHEALKNQAPGAPERIGNFAFDVSVHVEESVIHILITDKNHRFLAAPAKPFKAPGKRRGRKPRES